MQTGVNLTLSSIYKRKDGRWEGRIYKGNGNYVSYYAHSRQDIEELLLHMSEKSVYSECRHSFKELFTQWFDNISLNIKESTACNYKMKAKTHLIPYFKDINCSEVNEKDIYGFINIKREENLSDRYIADMIVMVKSVFKFGTKTYNYKNPFNGLKISFKKSEKVKVLDSEQYSALQKELASENSRTSAAVSLAMATGLRIGELCALQWKDVDIKKRIITVSKTIQRIKSEDTVNKTKIIITDSKTESSKRLIPVPECIVSIIEKLKSKPECFILSGTEKACEPRTLQYRFSKILSNAKLPSVHFHSLRHVFATRCLQSGMDVKTLSEILGHSRIETTLNLYVHSSFEQKIKALNMVDMGF